ESWIEVFDPRPLLGGCLCTASPAQNTLPDWRFVAYCSLLPHRETPVSSTSRSGEPMRLRMTLSASSSENSGTPSLISNHQVMSHSFHGRTIRTNPAPMPPIFEPG